MEIVGMTNETINLDFSKNKLRKIEMISLQEFLQILACVNHWPS